MVKKTYITRDELKDQDSPSIDKSELPPSERAGRRRDTYDILERDMLKSLGKNDFAAGQWSVAASYIWSRANEPSSKDVINASGQNFGTIDQLFDLIDRETDRDMQDWLQWDEDWM